MRVEVCSATARDASERDAIPGTSKECDAGPAWRRRDTQLVLCRPGTGGAGRMVGRTGRTPADHPAQRLRSPGSPPEKPQERLPAQTTDPEVRAAFPDDRARLRRSPLTPAKIRSSKAKRASGIQRRQAPKR